MFDRNKNESTTKLTETERPRHFKAEYMGGHKMYPKKTDCDVRMFSKAIEIEFGRFHNKNKITVFYDAITDLENMDDKRITKTRVLLTGFVIGLLWKKKFLYTVIKYKDQIGIDQTIVIDFGRAAEAAQQAIYQRMVEVKRLQ